MWSWQRSWLGGTLFASLMFFSSFFGTIYILTPMLPLMLIRPKWYRAVVDQFIAWWETFPVALLELVYGVRVRLTGDVIRPGERTLIIMNHRSRLDWMFLWACLLRRGHLSKEKIILKTSLKNIPGPGWAMQVGCFLFIKRRWDEDEKIFKRMLNYLTSIRHATQLLLFPEGTDLTEYTRKRSNDYAKEYNLPKYNYVLHPRTTGFVYIVEKLRKAKQLDSIHDITVGYPAGVLQNEMDLFAGRFPKEVHFHIRRHPLRTLPNTTGQLELWCTTRWAEKELQLKEFYQRKRFKDLNLVDGRKSANHLRKEQVKAILWLSILFWGNFVVMMLYLMVTNFFILKMTIIIAVFYIIEGLIFGGVEDMEIKLHNAVWGKLPWK
ncbi:Lysocardiolipin acyltransferase 1 [Branchiostoma belcheri]|nr:Lysocardiolipin acyltransferase 1 [Branchiostoma belcheri]